MDSIGAFFLAMIILFAIQVVSCTAGYGWTKGARWAMEEGK